MEIWKMIFLIWVVVSNIFYFHPCLGTCSKLTNIFEMGWNHQPVINWVICYVQTPWKLSQQNPSDSIGSPSTGRIPPGSTATQIGGTQRPQSRGTTWWSGARCWRRFSVGWTHRWVAIFFKKEHIQPHSFTCVSFSKGRSEVLFLLWGD